MVYHWSDSKSPQVSSTLLSIMADLNTYVVWMVSIHLLISFFSSLLSKPLGTVQTDQIPLYIYSSYIFLSRSTAFVVLLATSNYFFRLLWYSLCGQLGRQIPLYSKFFCFCQSSLGPAEEDVMRLFLLDWIWFVHVPFDSKINLNVFHDSQWITFPTPSYLLSYSVCTSLLHSLISLIVLSLSSQNPHLLFGCVLTIFTLLLLSLLLIPE